MKQLTITDETMKEIKERLTIWETWMDHPELVTQEDREQAFAQWRGAKYILRKLGIKIEEI